MYAEHVPLISNAMRNDYTAFQRGLSFVVCSIRQHIVNVSDQVAVLWREEPGESPLFGIKVQSWEFILSERCRELWNGTRAEYDPAALIWAFSRIPGIGIVKAGFVAQLMGADIGCLDSRNLKRMGRSPRSYESRGRDKTRPRYRRLIARYVADIGGQAQTLWDAWCADVGQANNMEPDAVSALHLAIVPSEYVPF